MLGTFREWYTVRCIDAEPIDDARAAKVREWTGEKKRPLEGPQTRFHRKWNTHTREPTLSRVPPGPIRYWMRLVEVIGRCDRKVN